MASQKLRESPALARRFLLENPVMIGKRAPGVVAVAPVANLFECMMLGAEPMKARAFVAGLSVEALCKSVLH